ncbi:MAG: hypothetical protein VKP62_14485 [Candidatus Sericytochromatia bacterium]|nr:hypothetical protein [Candidatus Sericytochromatia bacterium]
MNIKMLGAALCIAVASSANLPALANHHEGGAHAKPAAAHGDAHAKPKATPTPAPKAKAAKPAHGDAHAKPADHGHDHKDGHGHGGH